MDMLKSTNPASYQNQKENPLQIQYLQGVLELGQRDSNPRVQESKSRWVFFTVVCPLL